MVDADYTTRHAPPSPFAATAAAAAAMTMTMTATAAAPAGPAVGGGRRIFGSCMEQHPPAAVYQTHMRGSLQDSATPLPLMIRLSDAARESVAAALAADTPIDECVFGVIRRFDMKELEVLDEASGRMLGLRLPQKTFTFDFRASRGTVEVLVHRKELPVSKSFGGAPFVFVFYIPAVGEVVCTNAFTIASKEPTETKKRGARRPPKRIRGPPPRRPFAAEADGVEAAVNRMLADAAAHGDVDAAVAAMHAGSRKRVRVAAPAPSPSPAPVAAPAPIIAPTAMSVAPVVLPAHASPHAAAASPLTALYHGQLAAEFDGASQPAFDFSTAFDDDGSASPLALFDDVVDAPAAASV